VAETALRDVDVGVVRTIVGARSFQRGGEYAKQRVLDMRWDAADEALEATVVGQGAVYETVAYFSSDRSGRLGFVDGECSCPVGGNCKHVAAIVLAAVGRQRQPEAGLRGRRVHRAAPEQTWADALHALVPSPAIEDDGGGVPLAIEVTLDSGTPAGNQSNALVQARLVRRGRKGWVRSGVSWGALDSWQMEHGGFAGDHVDVLRELYALHQASARPASRRYYYSTNADQTIDLTTVDRSLWTLLDDARQVGLHLVHRNPALGEIPSHHGGELRLDVTRPGDAGLRITPELAIDSVDTDVVAVAFLGSRGHGVVYVGRADIDAHADPARWRIGLAQLSTPASPPLRTMLRTGERVEVPAGDEARFGEEVWPRLRHVAVVASSDGSFTPPAISAPRLQLQANYGAEHAVELCWSWVYDIGATTQRTPVDADPGGAGYRDPEPEQHIVGSLDQVVLEQFGLLTPHGRLRPEAQLTGLDTMRFATEAMPLLADDPRVVVAASGQPADFREVSDSVVVGVSTESVPGETDWFDLGITITVDGRDLPFGEVFLALASGDSHLLLPDGAYFSLLKPELQTLRRLIDEARALHDQPSDAMRISRYQIGWWDELCEIGVVRHQANAWARQVRALRAIESIGTVDVPAALTAELRPYQRDGFQWLNFLREHGLGGVLADDMGLGKTLQALALVCHARQRDPNLTPFLVVAPTSVVPGWLSEAHRFTPELSVVTVTDTLKRSGRTIQEVLDGAQVVVVSYTLLRLDFDAYRSVDWAGLFLDEAQHTKNHRSKIYSCLRQLPAPFKVAITGTPMENNLMELWSLLSITAPGLFPSPTRFAECYARPIERRGDVELLAQLRRRIKPLVKRRTKELVAAELPAKQEQVLDVELHPKHRRIYETYLQRERQKVLGLIDDFDRNRFTILRSLTLLRQLSLHPFLVDEACRDVPCIKIDTLVEQLSEVIDGGHRALVFSQFTQFLHLVRSRLDREQVPYGYLDGRTRKRRDVIERFKHGVAPVFLISLKAGGVGLNLTEADYCFLLDPWWNPATEAQAVDRSHRIGQTRNVMVYRMIAADTVEEKVMALKERKAHLFKGVMDDDNLFGGRLDPEDVRGLFS
jgi:superfamily II DNA or RNA helicase